MTFQHNLRQKRERMELAITQAIALDDESLEKQYPKFVIDQVRTKLEQEGKLSNPLVVGTSVPPSEQEPSLREGFHGQEPLLLSRLNSRGSEEDSPTPGLRRRVGKSSP